MLTAAERLAAMVAPRASEGTRALVVGPLRAVPDTATLTGDRTAYVERLDAVCRAVAAHLVDHFELPGPA